MPSVPQPGTIANLLGAFQEVVQTPQLVDQSTLTPIGSLGLLPSIKDYGAIGDGNSHPLSTRFGSLLAAKLVYPFVTALTQELDYAATQLATNIAGRPNGSGLIYATPGCYIIDTMVDVNNDGLTYFGFGPGFDFGPPTATKFRQRNQAMLPAIFGQSTYLSVSRNGCLFLNMQIDGNLANNTTTTSTAGVLPLGTVTVVSTLGFPASGSFWILTTFGAQQVAYTSKTSTQFLGCSGGGGTIVAGSTVWLNYTSGIQMTGTLVDVENVVCHDLYRGIAFQTPQVGIPAAGENHVRDCHIFDCWDYGVSKESDSSITNTTIGTCGFDENVNVPPNFWSGGIVSPGFGVRMAENHIYGCPRPIYCYYSDNCVITGNVFENNPGPPITFAGRGNNHTITGNWFGANSSGRGTFFPYNFAAVTFGPIDNAETALYNTVTGNHFSDTSGIVTQGFANGIAEPQGLGATTLNGAITNSATSIVVTSSAGFPAPNFGITIDDEAMLVTAVVGTTWTVTRNWNQPAASAVAHASGAPVAQLSADWNVYEGNNYAGVTGAPVLLSPGAIHTTTEWTQAVHLLTGTTYTTVMQDAQRQVAGNNAAAQTFTIPTHASVPYPIGASIAFTQMGAGKLSLAAAGGVTFHSPAGLVGCAAQYATIQAKQTSQDTWVLSGDLG